MRCPRSIQMAFLLAFAPAFSYAIEIPTGCEQVSSPQILPEQDKLHAQYPELSETIVVGPIEQPSAVEGWAQVGWYVDVLELHARQLKTLTRASFVVGLYRIKCAAKPFVLVELWVTADEARSYRERKGQSGTSFSLSLCGVVSPEQARNYRQEKQPNIEPTKPRPSSSVMTIDGKAYMLENGRLRLKKANR